MGRSSRRKEATSDVPPYDGRSFEETPKIACETADAPMIWAIGPTRIRESRTDGVSKPQPEAARENWRGAVTGAHGPRCSRVRQAELG
jgi:hypothetical protein